MNLEKKRKYFTGIDGLRTIAVVGVILYHLVPNFMPGGFLGVPLFFVISGYLITDSLLTDWESGRKIHLREFYFKRFNRLWPSLLAMFALSGAFMLIFNHRLLNNFREILISSFFSVNNWWQIANGESYFNRLATDSPYTHLWSLSVEGQFYLFFPIILGILLNVLKNKKQVVQVLVGLTIFSGVLMSLLFWLSVDVTRIYYGTDTRLFSILAGSLLAFYFHANERKKIGFKLTKRFSQVVGLASLIIILLMLFRSNDFNGHVYLGGMAIFTLFSTCLLGAVIMPNSVINRLLSNPVFKWVGQRSYEIYLWQYPVMIIYDDLFVRAGNLFFLNNVIKVIIILFLSEMTYRLIGRPFRKGLRGADFKLKKWQTLIVVGITLLFFTSVVTASSGEQPEQVAIKNQLEKNQAELLAKKKEKENELVLNHPNQAYLSSIGYDNAEIIETMNLSVSGIGDSLLLNISPDLMKVFPKINLDGKIGRQLYESEDVFKQQLSQKKMGDNVIVMLGTNGSFQESELEKLISIIGEDRQIYLVTVNVPKSWQTDVNSKLFEAAKKHKNVHIVDWQSYSANHPEWFYDDKIHTNEEGAQQLTKLLVETIIEQKK